MKQWSHLDDWFTICYDEMLTPFTWSGTAFFIAAMFTFALASTFAICNAQSEESNEQVEKLV